jgi:hypothetical protein
VGWNVSEGGDNETGDVHGCAGRKLQVTRVYGGVLHFRLDQLVPGLVWRGDHLLWARSGAASTTVVVTEVDPMAVPAG